MTQFNDRTFATKLDLAETESRLRQEIRQIDSGVRGEFNGLRREFGELRAEFNELRVDFADVRTEFQGLRTEVAQMENRLLLKFTAVFTFALTFVVGVATTGLGYYLQH